MSDGPLIARAANNPSRRERASDYHPAEMRGPLSRCLWPMAAVVAVSWLPPCPAAAADPPAAPPAGTAAPSTSAAAPDDATRLLARQIAEEGLALYDANKFTDALDRFRRAEDLVHAPTMGLMAARCLERLGKLVEASEKYLAVSRMPLAADASEPFRNAVSSASSEREALLPRIPGLVVQLEGASAGTVVSIDGAALPAAAIGLRRPIDPGVHIVTATTGPEVVKREIKVAERETATVILPVTASAAGPAPSGAPTAGPVAPASPMRAAGWVGISVGGAGLVAGAILGVVAISQKDALDKAGCSASLCPESSRADVGTYNTFRMISGASLIAGGVLAAAGITLLVVAPRQADAAPAPAPAPRAGQGRAIEKLAVTVRPGGLSVNGAF